MKRLVIIYSIVFSLIHLASAQNLQWREVGRMPIPVKGHRAVALDSVILVIGGFSDSLNSPVDFIQEYNPQTNTWRIIGQTKFKRTYFQASRFHDSLLFYGGISRSPTVRDYFSLEVWRRNSQPYIYKYNPIFNRVFSAGTSIENRIYLFGGKKSVAHIDTNKLNYLVEYDILKDSVTFAIERFPGFPELPFYQSVENIDENIFVFGGVSIGVMNSIYRFNRINRNFIRIPLNLLVPRAGSEAVEFNGNSILIIGGFNESQKALRTTEIFQYQGNTFSIELGPNMIFARREFAAVRYKNSVYVFGGENQFDNIVPFVEKLDLRTSVNTEDELLVDNIILDQNFPNPFNPVTNISFKIWQKSNVFLEIFDIFGKRVRVLVNSELEPGRYSFEWDGIDENGNRVSSGTYFYRIISGKNSITKKMLLIK